MTPLTIVVEPHAVNEYLTQHHLEEGSVPLVAVLLQGNATSSGRAALMFVVELPDGRKVVAKTTLNLMQMALAGCRGALQRLGLWDREQVGEA